MKAYFAVGWTVANACRLLAGHGALVSYALIRDGRVKPRDLDRLSAACDSLVIDSGAFTAWTQGRPVDAGAYHEWLRLLAVPWQWAIAVDVIGDEQGTRAGWRAVPEDLHARIVPVFHEGDSWDLLAEYEPEKRLVGLGRIEGRRSRKACFAWYDETFNRFPDGRFHALGNSSPETLEPYPFESFDATSWERNAAYSNALPFPYNRCDKATRMRAYVEACESIEHRAPAQQMLRLVGEVGR